MCFYDKYIYTYNAQLYVCNVCPPFDTRETVYAGCNRGKGESQRSEEEGRKGWLACIIRPTSLYETLEGDKSNYTAGGFSALFHGLWIWLHSCPAYIGRIHVSYSILVDFRPEYSFGSYREAKSKGR